MQCRPWTFDLGEPSLPGKAIRNSCVARAESCESASAVRADRPSRARDRPALCGMLRPNSCRFRPIAAARRHVWRLLRSSQRRDQRTRCPYESELGDSAQSRCEEDDAESVATAQRNTRMPEPLRSQQQAGLAPLASKTKVEARSPL